jgi:hypothetical protein
MLVITPDGYEYRTTYDGQSPTLEQLQSAVGGKIEGVAAMVGGEIREAYVNMEGKLEGLPMNPWATMKTQQLGFDIIAGNLVILVPRT